MPGEGLGPPGIRQEFKPKALDLFSGTGSVASRLRDLGYEVVTLDKDPKAKAQIIVDVMLWQYKRFPPKFFDLIAASVPCNEYSMAKTVGWRNLKMADESTQKVLEIIEYFKPGLWWVENLALVCSRTDLS